MPPVQKVRPPRFPVLGVWEGGGAAPSEGEGRIPIIRPHPPRRQHLKPRHPTSRYGVDVLVKARKFHFQGSDLTEPSQEPHAGTDPPFTPPPFQTHISRLLHPFSPPTSLTCPSSVTSGAW